MRRDAASAPAEVDEASGARLTADARGYPEGGEGKEGGGVRGWRIQRLGTFE